MEWEGGEEGGEGGLVRCSLEGTQQHHHLLSGAGGRCSRCEMWGMTA